MTVIAPGKRRLRKRLPRTKSTSHNQDSTKRPDLSVRLTKAKRQVYLTTEEAAEFLRLSPVTLARWRGTGEGPSFRRLGRKKIVYARVDLLKFAKAQKRQSTSDPDPRG